jgi:polysaccharide export outer membrane protein
MNVEWRRSLRLTLGRSWATVCGFLVLGLTGLAAQEPAPKPPEAPPTQENPDTGKKGEYLLQPRDVLEIRVYNLPELSVSLAIRPDGKISVPLLDEIDAAGLTTARLTAILTERYRSEFRNPRVTIIVRSFTNQNVFVGGEVEKPGLLPLDGEITVLQAVLRAGGVKESAKRDSVILLRNDGQGKPAVRKLNLLEVLKGKPDLTLQPYDVVFVPKTKIARADKWVDQYIRQMIPVGLGLNFAYLLSGPTGIF